MFKVIEESGDISTYPNASKYIDRFDLEPGEQVETAIVAALDISVVNSELKIVEYSHDDLQGMLDEAIASAEEWEAEKRALSSPSRFLSFLIVALLFPFVAGAADYDTTGMNKLVGDIQDEQVAHDVLAVLPCKTDVPVYDHRLYGNLTRQNCRIAPHEERFAAMRKLSDSWDTYNIKKQGK